ncbi:hypothetical protein E2493_00890 [Sphingomonas parva]|uniref:Uncharacterized protein n=1 Tax=Sphingomonas parva TaxID=2555898 RepID=A0A4Y8ZZ14_9SPHN|nr:hypothetical protein [Sphingomonas parva]TFI60299.1 hypothetical protein E2493_00890 [Sphingomonas parva]
MIRSFHNIGFFDIAFRPWHRRFIAFAERYFDVGSDPFDACVRWYLDWNARCEALGAYRVPIEKIEAEMPRILRHIGAVAERQGPAPSATYNKRPSVYSAPPSREAFAQQLQEHPCAAALASMSARYGYGSEPWRD